MPIALVASQLTEMASAKPTGVGRRDADTRPPGSFGRLLDAASSTPSAPTPAPVIQAKLVSRSDSPVAGKQGKEKSPSDSPVVGEQGKEKPPADLSDVGEQGKEAPPPPTDSSTVGQEGKSLTQSDAAVVKPQPQPQTQPQETDSPQTSPDSAHPKQTAPLTPSQPPELVCEPVAAKPLDKPKNEPSQTAVAPAMPTLMAVAVPVQQVQAQAEPQATETQASPMPAVPAAIQPGMMKQQVVPFQNESPGVSQQAASDPVAGTTSSSENSPALLPANDTFADGLEQHLKKLDPQSDADQPAQASTSSPAMNPVLAGEGNQRIAQPQSSQLVSQVQPPTQPEPFAQANQGSIINGIRTQLLPGGGTMQIRLSPPELGAMQVRVEMRGDSLAATFQTSNDQAAQLLTHNLGQLKQALEQQGVSVGRLQVVSSPKNDGASTGEHSGQPAMQWQGFQQQQNDQRREVLRQLWNRVAFGRDPIDVIA